MTPCVMYTRVSSEEQAKTGYSIPFQRARLAQHAAEHSLDIVARFEDVHSAKQTGRPSFEELLRFLEEHPEVRTVLVHRLDRLCRNVSDYALLVEHMGIRVRSVVEPAEDSPAGHLQHGIGVVVARYHSQNLTVEVKKGMRAKFEAGGLPGKAPVGYRNVPRTKALKATIVVDGDMAPIVRELFERYAKGSTSLKTLALELFDHGLQTKHHGPFDAEHVKDILTNPFYVGDVRYAGEVRPGIHEPLISRELFDEVRVVLRRRSSGTRNGRDGKFFLLRGLLVCGLCKRRMTAEDHVRGSYYRCVPDVTGVRCAAPYVPVAGIRAQVEGLLVAVELPSDRKTTALGRLRSEDTLRREALHTELPDLDRRAAKLKQKLLRLADALVGGDLGRDEHREVRQKVDAELRDIDERLTFLRQDFVAELTAQEGAIETASSLRAFYDLAATDEDRKDVLRRVLRTIEVTDKAITGIEYHAPFDLLLDDPFRAGAKTSKALPCGGPIQLAG